MKPVSTASSRSPSATRCVSAWPPRRSSASKRVTCAVREATYAAVSPATPEPTTARRGVGVSVIAALGVEGELGDDLVARPGGLGPRVLDADRGAVRSGGVPAEQHLVVRSLGHDPGLGHRRPVLEPEHVLLALRR